jgi:hypothetical protein
MHVLPVQKKDREHIEREDKHLSNPDCLSLEASTAHASISTHVSVAYDKLHAFIYLNSLKSIVCVYVSGRLL